MLKDLAARLPPTAADARPLLVRGDDRLLDWSRAELFELMDIVPGSMAAVELTTHRFAVLQSRSAGAVAGPQNLAPDATDFVCMRAALMTDTLAQQLPSALPLLRSVELRATSMSPAGLEAILSLPLLEELYAGHVAGREATFHVCPQRLTTLCLTYVKAGPSIAALTSLEHLSLSVAGPGAIAALPRLTQLRTLRLARSPITDAQLRGLGALTRLTTLALHGASNVTSAGVAALAPLLRRLRVLELPDSRVDARAATAIGEQLTSLTRLDLSQTDVAEWPGAAALQPLTALRELTLRPVQAMRDGVLGVEPLGRSLRQLRALSLRSVELGDAGAAAVAQLASLETLRLPFCDVGDAGATALAAALAPTLRALDLGYNDVGSAGVAAFAGAAALATVDLRHNARVGDSGLAAFCARAPALEQLNLMGLVAVGDATARALFHGNRRLRSLDLPVDPRLSAEGLELVLRAVRRRPQLAVSCYKWDRLLVAAREVGWERYHARVSLRALVIHGAGRGRGVGVGRIVQRVPEGVLRWVVSYI